MSEPLAKVPLPLLEPMLLDAMRVHAFTESRIIAARQSLAEMEQRSRVEEAEIAVIQSELALRYRRHAHGEPA